MFSPEFRLPLIFMQPFVQVKSVLDPCEDENEDIQNDDVSLGADSVQRDEYSESDSEVTSNICFLFLTFN